MLPGGSLEAPFPGYRPAISWVHYTTSCNKQPSAPEDGRDHRPKHVEMIGIINKPLFVASSRLSYIVRSNKYQIHDIVSLFRLLATE
jgi:hypothetical protein